MSVLMIRNCGKGQPAFFQLLHDLGLPNDVFAGFDRMVDEGTPIQHFVVDQDDLLEMQVTSDRHIQSGAQHFKTVVCVRNHGGQWNFDRAHALEFQVGVMVMRLAAVPTTIVVVEHIPPMPLDEFELREEHERAYAVVNVYSLAA